ncbi:MAG: hypothetical protein HQK49_05705 [Oligoflexia bacterium]|nr:hypothetical protein [Oligoflexia bacterium]
MNFLKNIFVLSSLLILTISFASADEIQDTDNNYNEYPSISFSIDKRPVDGALKVYTFTTNGYNSYNLKVYSQIISMMDGKTYESEKVVAENLNCKVVKNANVIKEITCRKDLRPVDGPLTEYKAVLDERNTYTITKRTALVDMRNGQNHDKTVEIGKGFEIAVAYR